MSDQDEGRRARGSATEAALLAISEALGEDAVRGVRGAARETTKTAVDEAKDAAFQATKEARDAASAIADRMEVLGRSVRELSEGEYVRIEESGSEIESYRRISLISVACSVALLVAFAFLLYIRGVSLNMLPELSLSVFIGVVARVLVELPSWQSAKST